MSPSFVAQKKNHTVWWGARLAALLALVLGYVYTSNPLLYSSSATMEFDPSFQYIEQNDVLDAVLNHYSTYFPSHLKHNEILAYKNHCLRVLTFAVHHYLNGSAYIEDTHAVDIMAMALAYHDLALWVTFNATIGMANGAGTLDYLHPSVQLLKWDQEQWMKRQSENPEDASIAVSPIPILSDYEIELVTEMILQHHKVTPWKRMAAETNTESSEKMEALVNAIRCADWADATMGVVRFHGLSLKYMAYVYHHLPESGFHETLTLLTSRISPASWWDRRKILRILKW